MIVDPSAVVAILLVEPGAAQLAHTILSADSVTISAASYVEAAAVLDRRRRDPVVRRRLDELLEELEIRIAPFDAEQARIARDAYRDFGRGSGHPARLNLGDVFSYALAKATGEPLLFVGSDFARTDVEPALRLGG